MSEPYCPFCHLPDERIQRVNDEARVVRDGYPVSPGHSLVIPRRHVGSFFELNAVEREAMFALLEATRLELDASMQPAGYNIGINDGPCAGQTVAHVHLHLIPRFAGDVADPRGGVRWVIPDKAKYWD